MVTQPPHGCARRYAPTTFAELSDRRSADSPSNSTAEGTHVRCFERLLLAKIHGEGKRGLPPHRTAPHRPAC